MTTREFTIFVLGFLVGVPLVIFGVDYLADNVTSLVVATERVCR